MLSEEYVAKVAAGIREFNNRPSSALPIVITFDRYGKQVPLTPTEQSIADKSWLDAVRYGLESAELPAALERPSIEELVNS